MPGILGIPRGLLFLEYEHFWRFFFQKLNIKLILSPDTNKEIMEDGLAFCEDQACLPVKIFHGHVLALQNKVDLLFIPRIRSLYQREYFCPLICGLPEMVKNTLDLIPPVIDNTVDFYKRQTKSNLENMALSFSTDPVAIKKAYHHAFSVLRQQNHYKHEVLVQNQGNNTIAIIGHPYNIADSYMNMNLVKKIEQQGFQVVTSDLVPEEEIQKNISNLPKRIFWSCGKRILGAGLYFLHQQHIAGIIYVSCFGCGVDSLIESYLSYKAKQVRHIPYLLVSLDEHTGEAGLNTRIEAFLDMIDWRRFHANYVSSYGRNIYSS